MQQQQKQSTPLPHRGMLSQKLPHLQDLHRQVEIQQIVANSMLVVVSQKVGTSILMAGKQAIQSSLMLWDTEILTTALPVLLWASAGEATSGRPGLPPRPTVEAWASVRVTWARSIRTSVRTGSPSVRSQNKFDYLIILACGLKPQAREKNTKSTCQYLKS